MPTTRRATRGKRARERLEPTRGSRMDERCTGNQPGPARRLTLPEHSGAVHAAPARRPIGRCAAIAAVAGEDGNRACGRRKRPRDARRHAHRGGAHAPAVRCGAPPIVGRTRPPTKTIRDDLRAESCRMPGWIRRTHAWIGEMPARTDRRDAQAIAPARRPDVPGAYAAAQASAAKIKAAESEFMPKVFVSASTPYNAGRAAINAIPPVGQQAPTVNLNGSRYGGGVFVGVTIPRYDVGLRSAVLMQARNDADSASARLERTKDEGRRTKRSGRSSPGRTRCARVSRRTMRRRRSSTPRRPLRRRARRVPARRRLDHRRDARAERPARRANRVRGQLRRRAVGRGVARARDGDGRADAGGAMMHRRNDRARLSLLPLPLPPLLPLPDQPRARRPRRVAPRLARRRTKRDRASPPRQAPPTNAPSRRVSAPSGCASSSSTEKCVRPGTCTRRTGSPAAAHACA